MKSVKVFDDLSMMPIGVMNLNQLRDEMGDAVVESVEVVDGNLVITFNTASGKQPITIPLSELSQPLIIETPVNTTDATLPITTLTCEVGKYYRIDVAVDTLAVTLPAMTDLTTVRTVVLYFTAGTTPDLTITAADNKRVVFQNGYEINSGMTYEIKCLYNGAAWTVTAVESFIETKLVVYYDIQDISSPTTIFTNYDNSVKSIEVDGVLLDSVVTTYQFDSVGEHVIKYEFNNPTTVGSRAPLFNNVTMIKSAVIADTFTSIGERAFSGCLNLTSITIPDSVTSIGDYAFMECSSLTSIIIPDSVTSIGQYAFQGCMGLTSITIPYSVTSIGQDAFNNCRSLTNITIPDSVTSIGSGAFIGCTNLANITSDATTAPAIQNSTFQNVKTGGTLHVPAGSTGYDTWMGTGNYYLGKYNWTKVEQ